MVEQIRDIGAQIKIDPVMHAEGTPQRGIEQKLIWACDGAAGRCTPLSGQWWRISCGVEKKSFRSLVNRRSGIVRSNGASYPRVGHCHRIDRCLGQTAGRRDLRETSPLLEESTLPSAHQRSAADAHSRRVLYLQI